MDKAATARRLLAFASSTAVEPSGLGPAYPRAQFQELLVDILMSTRGMQKRGALSIVRDAMVCVTLLD